MAARFLDRRGHQGWTHLAADADFSRNQPHFSEGTTPCKVEITEFAAV
jgi:hypothetical protein